MDVTPSGQSVTHIAGGVEVTVGLNPYSPTYSDAFNALDNGGTVTVCGNNNLDAGGTWSIIEHELIANTPQYGPHTYQIKFVMPSYEGNSGGVMVVVTPAS